MEKQYFTLIGEDGSETRAEILFTYHSKEFNKNYVVFVADDASNTVGAASFIENGNQGTLDPITTDEEWELIEDLLEQFVAEQQNGHSCCHGEGCDCEECDCDGECDGEEECNCGCHKNAN